MMKTIFSLSVASILASNALAQSKPPGVTTPIVEDCGGFNGSVVCVNRYVCTVPVLDSFLHNIPLTNITNRQRSFHTTSTDPSRLSKKSMISATPA